MRAGPFNRESPIHNQLHCGTRLEEGFRGPMLGRAEYTVNKFSIRGFTRSFITLTKRLS